MAKKCVSIFSVAAIALLAATFAQAGGVQAAPGELPGPVAPQQVGPVGSATPPVPDTYGVDHWAVANIPGSELHPYRTALGYNFYAGGLIGPQDSDPFRYFETAVHIPTGALVQGVTPFYYDNSTGDITLYLWQYEISNSGAGVTTTLWTHQSSGTPGYFGAYQAFLGAITWVNYQNVDNGHAYYYNLRINFSAADGANLCFEGITFWYKMQISPAPATATFADVPVGAFAFQQIEALAASGITAGCGGGNFCPNVNLTRAQMAVFLAKGLGLHWPDLN